MARTTDHFYDVYTAKDIDFNLPVVLIRIRNVGDVTMSADCLMDGDLNYLEPGDEHVLALSVDSAKMLVGWLNKAITQIEERS